MESYATIDGGIETSSFDVAVVDPEHAVRTRLAIELAGAAQFTTIEELVANLGGRLSTIGPGIPTTLYGRVGNAPVS